MFNNNKNKIDEVSAIIKKIMINYIQKYKIFKIEKQYSFKT